MVDVSPSGYSQPPAVRAIVWRVTRVWVLSLLAGCLVTPVIPIGKGKSRQQVVHEEAARITPGSLQAVEGWRGETTTVKVRVWADDEYRAQHVRWQPTFQALLDDANDVFSAQFGVRFVASYQAWNHRMPGARLEDHLAELHAHDPGTGVFLVIGLTSSLSLATTSFDQLGVAALPGRHLVIRGYSDVQERQVLESAFRDLRKEEREVMYEARRRHKSVAVLLHELGHNLGAAHAADPSSLMLPTYSVEATSFDATSRAAILAHLERRLGRASLQASPATPGTGAGDPGSEPPDAPLPPLVLDPTDKTPFLEIVIDARGQRTIGGKPVADATLDGLLLLQFGDHPRTRVYIRSRRAPAGVVDDVVARARRAGLSRVTVLPE